MNSAVSPIGEADAQPARAMRPERVAALAIGVLTIAGWLALTIEAMRQGSGIGAFVQAICRPVGLERPLDLSELWSQYTLVAGFWVAILAIDAADSGADGALLRRACGAGRARREGGFAAGAGGGIPDCLVRS